jgi:hypothetical protein
MSLLSSESYRQAFEAPMTRVTAGEAPPFNFWPYFDEIPPADFEGHDCSAGQVTYVYRDASGLYEHVLIDSKIQDVFMALVLDRRNLTVVGHRLLNLPGLYESTLSESIPERPR